jgi:hypothetical protein
MDQLGALLTEAAHNGMRAYISQNIVDESLSEYGVVSNRVASSILRSARLSHITGGIQSTVSKALYTEGRAKGPTQPGTKLPYQDTLTPDEIEMYGNPQNNKTLIDLANSDIGRIHLDPGERASILHNGGDFRAANLLPIVARRIHARCQGVATDDVYGPQCESINCAQFFDALTPGDISLVTAVLTARTAGTKSHGGMDTFAYFACEENNDFVSKGEHWQRSGALFASVAAICNAWNATVQVYYGSPHSGTMAYNEMQPKLFTTNDARRAIAAISLVAQAHPDRVERELLAFHPHIADPKANARAQLLQRHSPAHIAHIVEKDIDGHVEACVTAHALAQLEVQNFARSASTNATHRLQQDGELVISDGVNFKWMPPVGRSAPVRNTVRDRTTPHTTRNTRTFNASADPLRAPRSENWRVQNRRGSAPQV